MNLLDNSLLTVLLTLAATFLGLSIVVQVVQELYKYLRSSKGRAYQIALKDFLGPLALELLKPGVLPDVRVRGPLQLKRVRPEGMILPLKREELSNALERTAPPWIQQTLNQLKLEVDFQSNKPLPPSPSWDKFLEDLGKVEQGTTGYWNAFEIAEFLQEWKYNWNQKILEAKSHTKCIGTFTLPHNNLDAKQLLLAFRKKFLPYVENAVENFSKLESNFEYSYSRANRRQTFIIAMLITFIFNLPINILYKNAQKIDPESAIKLAETTMEMYKSKSEVPESLIVSNQLPDSLIQKNLELAKKIMSSTLKTQSSESGIEYFSDWESIVAIFSGNFKFLLYLFYCGITSIFLTFGAPFWNDIASALLRLQKGSSPVKKPTTPETNNG
jgi:hypothetical protein